MPIISVMADGCTVHAWVPCQTYDELRDRPCPGTIEYRPGDLDAPCDTCGGRCGWLVAGIPGVASPR